MSAFGCLAPTRPLAFVPGLGPFLFLDRSLLPAGPRAIAAALHKAGFTRTRIVMRQLNPNLQISQARIDGRIPEMLFVSSMQIHSASAYEMIRDAHALGDARPFILAGGAKAIYEPWDFFDFPHEGRAYDADAACTGEEFVLLELLDRIMEARGNGEHPRKAFHRLRRSGLLDDILGLVYRPHDWQESVAPRPLPPESKRRAGRASARARSKRTRQRRMSRINSWKRRRRLVCSTLVSRNFIAAHGTVR